MRVAIIGAGSAGLAAASALREHDVEMFEAAGSPGGHVYTVDADGYAIDMGFIVCNRERYPRLFALLGELGIETRPTTMSFSVSLPGEDFEWGSESLSAVFADRRRLLDPRHWRFLVEVVRFLERARTDLATGSATGELGDYLERACVPADVRDRFIVPLAAALWSIAPEHVAGFPAATYLAFLDQHGMLRPLRPLAWHTIVGGSRRYVTALLAVLRATGRFALHTAAPVTTIARDARGVTVVARGREHRYDRIVIATHADTALTLLAAPTEREHDALAAFRYSRNHTVLHRDRSLLPRRAAAHAAWNYVADPDTAQVAVTYSMTRLQGLPDAPYLVTLNPRRPIADPIHETTFDHPQFDAGALAAQSLLPNAGRGSRTYYAGAHLGFGFHEDGIRSGIAAATRAIADDRHG